MSMVLILFAYAKSGDCFNCRVGFLIKYMGMKLGL